MQTCVNLSLFRQAYSGSGFICAAGKSGPRTSNCLADTPLVFLPSLFLRRSSPTFPFQPSPLNHLLCLLWIDLGVGQASQPQYHRPSGTTSARISIPTADSGTLMKRVCKSGHSKSIAVPRGTIWPRRPKEKCMWHLRQTLIQATQSKTSEFKP